MFYFFAVTTISTRNSMSNFQDSPFLNSLSETSHLMQKRKIFNLDSFWFSFQQIIFELSESVKKYYYRQPGHSSKHRLKSVLWRAEIDETKSCDKLLQRKMLNERKEGTWSNNFKSFLAKTRTFQIWIKLRKPDKSVRILWNIWISRLQKAISCSQHR